MNRDPQAWEILGRAIRDSRSRLGLTLAELAARTVERGGSVSDRTIGDFERGKSIPKRGKPQKLEEVVAALGWQPGFVDRILNGEDPAQVLGSPPPSPSEGREASVLPARQAALELLPGVYDFTRAAVEAGGDPVLRDELETAVRNLIASIPGRPATSRSSYGLVAYSPHRAGEPPAEDDAERIQRALKHE